METLGACFATSEDHRRTHLETLENTKLICLEEECLEHAFKVSNDFPHGG